MTFKDLANIKQALLDYQKILSTQASDILDEINEKGIKPNEQRFFISQESAEEYDKAMRKLTKQHQQLDEEAIFIQGLIETINLTEMK